MKPDAYFNSQDIWILIDQLSQSLTIKSEDPLAKNTESYKMFILGQREMLDRIMDYLAEHELSLEDLQDLHQLVYRYDSLEKENELVDQKWDNQNILDKEG